MKASEVGTRGRSFTRQSVVGAHGHAPLRNTDMVSHRWNEGLVA